MSSISAVSSALNSIESAANSVAKTAQSVADPNGNGSFQAQALATVGLKSIQVAAAAEVLSSQNQVENAALNILA